MGGAEELEVKALGRWKSDAVRGYVDASQMRARRKAQRAILQGPRSLRQGSGSHSQDYLPTAASAGCSDSRYRLESRGLGVGAGQGPCMVWSGRHGYYPIYASRPPPPPHFAPP